MTRLGEIIARNSINKADLARRIGVKRQRVSDLCLSDISILKAQELYDISKALNYDLKELADYLFAEPNQAGKG